MKEKNIRKNYLYNLTFTLLNSALPLLTAPYLARVVGAEGIGIYAYCHAIASLFYSFAKLGLTNYGTRLIASCDTENDGLSYSFSSIFYQQLLFSVLSTGTYWVVCRTFLHGGPYQDHAYILTFTVLAGAVDIDWLYSGLEEFKSIALKNILVKTGAVVLIFIFVRDVQDLVLYSWIMSLSTFLGFASMWIGLRKKVRFCAVKFEDIFAHIRPNLVLFVPVLSMSLYRNTGKIMLGSFCSSTETGLFENAEKIILTLSGFITSYNTVMMPRISNMLARGLEKSSKEYLILSMQFLISLMAAMFFGLFAVADDLTILLFGPEFARSGDMMALLAVTLVFMGWSNVIRSQYIIPMKKDSIFIITLMLGAVVNIAVNALMIPKFGAMGAVIGTVCAEGCIPLAQFLILRKELPYKAMVKETLFAPVCGLIMLFVLRLAERTLPLGQLPMLCVQIICGVVVYCGAVLLYFIVFKKALKAKK